MFTSKEEFIYEFTKRIISTYGRAVSQSHKTEQFMVLENMVRDYASINWAMTKDRTYQNGSKQLYYFSIEFLMGRLLVNNLKNLGIYEIALEGLNELNIDIHDLEELEADAGLGNGGLGRLAACFLDSLASLSYPGNGNTIRYEYGLFKQLIENGYQKEVPDQWLKLGYGWEVRKPKHEVEVKFWGHVVYHPETNTYEHKDAEIISAIPYDVPIVGKDTYVTNTLRLWHGEPSDKLPSNKDFRQYNQEIRDLCQNLYPNDSTLQGKTLRLKQEYFLSSAGIQSIVKYHLTKYENLDHFHDQCAIQLNDTHPVLCIPELMRILIDEYHYPWLQAWYIVSHTFAYTNHTVLIEALEKWPVTLMQALLPRIYMIIEEIHHRFYQEVVNKTGSEEKANRLAIIKEGYIDMAYLAIVGSFSVNGVAYMHTQILKNEVMKEISDYFPGKFNNKTNGVTHRRWLIYANSNLTSLISSYIGEGWITQPKQLEKLMDYKDDPELIQQFKDVKQASKKQLIHYIKQKNHIELDPESLFIIQVKRIHGYKRQLLNILAIIYMYFEIKNGDLSYLPKKTFIFGGKAAPSYYFAKNIIKLINSVANKVNQDPIVSQYLKVVFIENYDVTLAEKIVPAADISVQISTAGKEASGTGNMKFMMNGALTLGTMDGANVEILDRVGKEHIEIFGLTTSQIQTIKSTYKAWDIYHNDPKIKRVVDSLVDGTFEESKEEFRMIYEELMNRNDEYYVLADLKAYLQAIIHIQNRNLDQNQFIQSCLINIAKSGYFSSDRTVEEYVDDIWHLQKVE